MTFLHVPRPGWIRVQIQKLCGRVFFIIISKKLNISKKWQVSRPRLSMDSKEQHLLGVVVLIVVLNAARVPYNFQPGL